MARCPSRGNGVLPVKKMEHRKVKRGTQTRVEAKITGKEAGISRQMMHSHISCVIG